MWNFGEKPITLYENWKRYIRTLKTLHPNFENALSEFTYVLDVMYVLRKRRKFLGKKSHSAEKPKLKTPR